MRSTGSTQKKCWQRELSQEKSFTEPKKIVKASNKNDLVNSANCNILHEIATKI